MLKNYLPLVLLISALELGKFAQHHNAPQFNLDRSVFKGGNKSHMTCFTLYNREHESIDNAEFILNGKRVLPGSNGQYCIDNISGPPYNIIIRHRDYLEAEYNNLHQLSGQLYLLREGEDYYYQSFFKVPCLRRRDLLVVSMRSVDSSGNVIQPESARKALNSLLEPMNMRLIMSYGELYRDQPRTKGIDVGSQWSYIYLIGRSSGGEFDEIIPELAELRRSREIAFAGPALVRDEGMLGPFSYHPHLNVSFKSGIDSRKAQEILSSMGFDRVVASQVAGEVIYTVILPPEVGMGMNRVIERLRERDEIINAQPEMWMPE